MSQNQKKKVPCRVGGWEVEAVPGTAYTFGDGARYWGPWPLTEVPAGEEQFFVGLDYAQPINQETVIESQGDYHDILLRITSDAAEVSGGIHQDAAFAAAVEETGGDRNNLEANTRYTNIVAEALTDVVGAVVAAGIAGREPEYKEHDSYCEAKLQLRDGRTLVLCAHYYDGNFDAQIGEEQ